MLVVHLTTPERLEVRDLPARREAGPKEVLLEPLCVGLSGTDALRFRAGAPTREGFRQPHIPGSEFVARVVGFGRGTDTRLRNKRVVANPVSPCFHCLWCEEGRHNLCPNVRTLGEPPVAGALQQRFAWPARLCVPVPKDIPDHVACLLVPLANVIHILDVADLRPMSKAAVVGCGHQGLLLIRAMKACGVAEVVAVDMLEERRQQARENGADHAFEPYEAERFLARWPRAGVDVAVDVANTSEAARAAIALARIGGRTLLAGMPHDNRILFNANEARAKELCIQFIRRPHDTYNRAVALLRSGRLGNVESLITHIYEFDQIQEAFQTVRHARDGVIKAVVRMPAYQPREESPEAIYAGSQEAEGKENKAEG